MREPTKTDYQKLKEASQPISINPIYLYKNFNVIRLEGQTQRFNRCQRHLVGCDVRSGIDSRVNSSNHDL